MKLSRKNILLSSLFFGCVLLIITQLSKESETESGSNAKNERDAHLNSETPKNSARLTSDGRRITADKRRADYQKLVGMSLHQQHSLSEAAAWSDSLSRNKEERNQREVDLKHLIRAEVINFEISDETFEKLKAENLPVTIPLRLFNGEDVNVSIDHMNVDGIKSGSLSGRFEDDPDTWLVLGMHKGETSGFIQGPDALYFLDAFDSSTVILREIDAVAHAGDFRCECQLHQAQAASPNGAAASPLIDKNPSLDSQ